MENHGRAELPVYVVPDNNGCIRN